MRYETLLSEVLADGEKRTDRTGVGTRSLFGRSLSYSLEQQRVALVDTKKVAWKTALRELLWMIRGETNVAGLGPAATIWSAWADSNGDLGPVYGSQWRGTTRSSWFRHDQLLATERLLRDAPDTRRAVMSTWNVADLDEMALQPCPVLWQFSVREGGLELAVFQRSADMFLGVPFDLFEASVLAHLMADRLGIKASRLHWFAGDVHIYENHVEQVRTQLVRPPGEVGPQITLPGAGWEWDSLEVDDFSVLGYYPWPALHGEVAV